MKIRYLRIIEDTFQNKKKSLLSLIRPYDFILILTILVGLIIWVTTGIPILPLRPWMVSNSLFIAKILVAGLIAMWISRWILAVWRHRRADRRIRRMIFNRHFGWRTLAEAFRWLASVEIIITIYTTIKQAIPLINNATYDNQLIAIEKWIHFGLNPAWALANLNPPLWWTKLLDINYYLWFIIKPLFFSYFLTHRNKNKRDHFISVYLGVWVVGVLIGLAVPSHGPCYVDPEHFPVETMRISQHVQDKLWEAYQNLSRITFSGNGGMTFGMGLMALPSLHVTVCILYVYFFWSEGLWWRWGTIIFTLMIFLGSLYSGWHYAIDGYVGILIVLLVAWTTKNLCYDQLLAYAKKS
ncbi:MAG: phosphatase PAP2 family protein [Desulfobacteraceae bacterium]